MSEKLFMDTFSITNSKVINQIKTSVESFNYSIVTATNNISQSGTIKSFLTQSDADSLSMIKSYYNMNIQMGRIQSNLDAYEVGITVIGTNGRNYSTNRSYWPISEKELPNHPITMETYEYPKKLMYHYDQPKVKDIPLQQPTIIASKSLLERTTGIIYGAMYITMQESEFRRFYENYTSEGNDVLIVNNSGTIVSSNQQTMIGQHEKELLDHAIEIEQADLNYKSIEFHNSKQIVLAEYLPSLDMYLVNLIDQDIVMHNIIDKKAITLISITVVSIALLFVFIILRRLTNSLTSLVKQISRMPKHDFNHYVTVSGSYETKELAIAFNDMLDELHEYVEQLLLTQKKQRNAELASLQQQINPHFLYNTLASIKIIVQQGNRQKAEEMINKLIALLQNALGNVSETITVEEELQNMKNYVFINQARYGEQVRVNYYVSPDCLTYHLPKLIIQPFIENAFFHGFNLKTSGFIHIMIGQEDDSLICEIVDNGDGMEVSSDERLPNYKSKRQLFSGIGIKNVDERIKLLYGKDYGVEISSVIGEGTKVRICLPITKYK
jgi:two-component system sensor histidine kinase YesM